MAVSYPVLAPRLGGDSGAQRGLFHLVFVGFLSATLALAWTGRPVVSPIVDVARRLPGRSILLVCNLAVSILLSLAVFTEWGVTGILAVGALVGWIWAVADPTRARRGVEEVIRGSPLSFGALYVMLLVGELTLRANPMLVGGGGGGNPALGDLYTDLYSINSLGLRDPERTLTAPAGARRILVLGDSFTFGQGVADDSTFVRRMEAELNRGVTRHEVINGGHSGSTTWDELEYFRQEGHLFSPHLVLVQFLLNDIDQREGPQQSINRVVDLLIKRPVAGSYGIFFLRYRWDQLVAGLDASAQESEEGRSSLAADKAREIRTQEQSWLQFKQALAGLAEETADRNVPLVMVLFPHPMEVDSEAMRFIHREVGTAASELEVDVIDLLDSFEGLTPAELVVSDIDHHPSSRAHGRAAETILRELRAMGHIEDPTGGS